MTMTFNPDAAANDKKKTDTFNPLAQFESMKFDTAIPGGDACLCRHGGDAVARGL